MLLIKEWEASQERYQGSSQPESLSGQYGATGDARRCMRGPQKQQREKENNDIDLLALLTHQPIITYS